MRVFRARLSTPEDDIELIAEPMQLSPEDGKPRILKHNYSSANSAQVDFATGGGPVAEFEDDEIVDLAALDPKDPLAGCEPHDMIPEIPSHQGACGTPVVRPAPVPAKASPTAEASPTGSVPSGKSEKFSSRACTIM